MAGKGGDFMNDNLLSTKFIMALIGIALCVVWAVFKLEKEYLLIALGFTGLYSTANIIQKFTPEK
jgi:hypothetical protein